MFDYRRYDEPLYESSQSEPGGVVIKVKKTVYYFDLKRITDYVYHNEKTLKFKLIGQRDMEFVNGELAKCLFAALSDWHGKVNVE